MSPESHKEVINLTRLNEIRRQVASLTGEEKELVLTDTQKDLIITIRGIKIDENGYATWSHFSEESVSNNSKKIFENREIKDLNSDYFEYNHSYKNLEQFLQKLV